VASDVIRRSKMNNYTIVKPTESPHSDTVRALDISLEKTAGGEVWLRIGESNHKLRWTLLVLKPDGTCETRGRVPTNFGLDLDPTNALRISNWAGVDESRRRRDGTGPPQGER